MSWTIIHLRYLSPGTLSDLPGSHVDHMLPKLAPLFGLAPGGVYLAINVATNAVRSYHTISPLPTYVGGIFSVALSMGSHPPGITWHPVLWSPDFPLLNLHQQRLPRPTLAMTLALNNQSDNIRYWLDYSFYSLGIILTSQFI